MKNRSSFIKFVILFGMLLLLLFLITFFSLLKIFIFKEKKVEKEILEVKYKLNNTENLVFDFSRSSVVFRTTNRDELTIIQNTKEEKLFLNINDSGNRIIVEENSVLFKENEKKYTIRIPKTYMGKITITNGFGKMNLYNIKSGFNLDNNAGEINVFNSNDVNIKDVSGTLNLTDIDGYTNLNSSTGDINIKNIKGVLNIDSLTGNIIINNFRIDGDSKIENISGDIRVIVNNDSVCKIKSSNQSGESSINNNICNNKKNILEVDNVIGNINIK